MNEFRFIKTGTNPATNKTTFKLAAPTPNDIGYEFYVISLW